MNERKAVPAAATTGPKVRPDKRKALLSARQTILCDRNKRKNCETVPVTD